MGCLPDGRSRYPDTPLQRHPAAVARSVTSVSGLVVMRSSKTKGDLRLEESQIDIPGAQSADTITLADRRRHLPRSGLAKGAFLRKRRT
jgi:hypothetical protein